MSVIYVVLPLALLIAVGAVVAFIWAARGGQFDDLDTPSVRILHDDVDSPPPQAPTDDTEPAEKG